MSKKLAPPGRRGSVKREAFKPEEAEIIESVPVPVPVLIDNSVAERNRIAEEERERIQSERRRQEEEADRLAAQRKQQQQEQEARAAAELKRRQDEEAEKLSERRREEERRALVQRARQQEEAQAAAELKGRHEEEAQKQMERRREEERRVVADRARQQEEAQAAGERQRQEEEARAAAARRRQQKEEEERAEAAAAAAAAEAERLRREKESEEEQRHQEEIARLLAEKKKLEDNEARLAQERQQQAETAQREAAERKRREDEERAARAAALKLEEERLAVEVKKKIEEAAERRRAEEEAQRLLEQEEGKKREQERLRAQEEAARVAAELQAQQDAELQEKKKAADEQRKKRAMFLAQMDTFASDFETKTQLKEEELQESDKKKNEILSNVKEIETSLKEKTSQPIVVPVIEEEPPKPVKRAEPAVIPPAVPEPVVVYKTKSTANAENNQDVLNDLTSTLFEAKAASTAVQALEPTSTSTANTEQQQLSSLFGSSESIEELRVPTRIGKAKESTSTEVVPAKINTPPLRSVSLEADLEEEEGTGELDSISNIFTKEERKTMSVAAKANWRAKAADLHTQRKNFHGAVTLMFDGIFSWQMYGSAEAIDEFGNTYTEYLMRCQWGSTFENLQPWIVAHRYKEFDKLDQDLKKRFPQLEKNMPKLPKKEIFRTMDSNVVSKRRAVLEEYMSKVVQSMPTILRSDLVDKFLRISERIGTIKNLLNLNHQQQMSSPHEIKRGEDSAATVISTNNLTSVTNARYHNETDPFGLLGASPEPLQRGRVVDVQQPRQGEKKVEEEEEEEIEVWTADQAEELKEVMHTKPMDEDQLGRFEEDVRALVYSMKNSKPKDMLKPESSVRMAIKSIARHWPALRATSVVGMGVDFSLIPRALQVEEDLVKAINEFRNLETIKAMV